MQRRRLLSAIMAVLVEHGFEGASVGRICKRAGVSRRTFYDLFDDRDDCFIAAFDVAIERLTGKVVPVYTRTGNTPKGTPARHTVNWRERVRDAFTVLLECFDGEPGLAQLCVVETLKGGPEVLARRRQVLEVLTVAIDDGRSEAKGVEPPPLTAESTVGGALAVIHARLVKRDSSPLVELLNPLMSMIVHPYLGPAAARRELDRPVPAPAAAATRNGQAAKSEEDPFKDLPIRITFRTARVLDTIGASPGASNREVGEAAGVIDQGQMSKLLRRLENAGLIDNHGQGQIRGEANAWRLTTRGQGLLRVVGSDTGHG
jgi:AcrR family transcriptional regulator